MDEKGWRKGLEKRRKAIAIGKATISLGGEGNEMLDSGHHPNFKITLPNLFLFGALGDMIGSGWLGEVRGYSIC